MGFEIDKKYWDNLRDNHEEASDRLGSLITQAEMHIGMQQMYISSMTDLVRSLKIERKQIVSESARAYSDILARIDVFRLPDEHIYDAAMRIIDEWESTKVAPGE